MAISKFLRKRQISSRNVRGLMRSTARIAQAKYTLEIKDAKGIVLLRQTEGVYNWTAESEVKVGQQPAYHIPGPDQRSFNDWMQAGKEDELNGRVLRALDIYKETLRRFPDSFLAQKAAGRLAHFAVAV